MSQESADLRKLSSECLLRLLTGWAGLLRKLQSILQRRQPQMVVAGQMRPHDSLS